MRPLSSRKPKNALIILCAGLGKRMGMNRPKMLIPLLGRPILYWALKNLQKCKVVHSVVLVAPPDCREDFEKKIRKWGFKKVVAVVEGGKERIDSARKALDFIPRDCGYVGIHDGARPFVSAELLGQCFRSARQFGSAILAVPCKNTIKMIRQAPRRKGEKTPGYYIEKTLPRHQCWSAQTPQVFRRDIAEEIHRAYADAGKRKSPAIPTDDASLAESLGYKVRIVPGSYENIKITTPDDLILAEAVLGRMK